MLQTPMLRLVLYGSPANLDVRDTIMWMTFRQIGDRPDESDDDRSEDSEDDEEHDEGFELVDEEYIDENNRLCSWWKGLKMNPGSKDA